MLPPMPDTPSDFSPCHHSAGRDYYARAGGDCTMPREMTPTLDTQAPAAAGRRGLLAWGIFWGLGLIALAALLADNARLDTYCYLATRWTMGDQADRKDYTWEAYRAAHAAPADAS